MEEGPKRARGDAAVAALCAVGQRAYLGRVPTALWAEAWHQWLAIPEEDEQNLIFAYTSAIERSLAFPSPLSRHTVRHLDAEKRRELLHLLLVFRKAAPGMPSDIALHLFDLIHRDAAVDRWGLAVSFLCITTIRHGWAIEHVRNRRYPRLCVPISMEINISTVFRLQSHDGAEFWADSSHLQDSQFLLSTMYFCGAQDPLVVSDASGTDLNNLGMYYSGQPLRGYSYDTPRLLKLAQSMQLHKVVIALNSWIR